ncbi:MAG: cytochrome P450, partial [Actinomycetota bacterium]
MGAYPKHVNHDLGPMTCPVDLASVDLFGVGAQEHWYEMYEILHRDAPVLRIPGGGLKPDTDAFVLTKHADIAMVVKDPERFIVMGQRRVGEWADTGMSVERAYEMSRNLMTAS